MRDVQIRQATRMTFMCSGVTLAAWEAGPLATQADAGWASCGQGSSYFLIVFVETNRGD